MNAVLAEIDAPAPSQVEILRSLLKRNPSAEQVKHKAARIFAEKQKHMRCFYSGRDDRLLASFRYLDESDYAQFPVLRGNYNAVIVPADQSKAPYLHQIINLDALKKQQA